MGLKLGNVFLRPSPQFALRHVNLCEKWLWPMTGVYNAGFGGSGVQQSGSNLISAGPSVSDIA